ncbi:hypothetical protein A4G19_15830 [Pasteurellaceae bacterium Macca]|nr:hypothetical protein [Pasteurellaceae bacterium Macca]MCK3656503.1 hypothetical protein [Pasteurellaceae bacterium Macca]MCK3656726.1 hypothetical protein [Pasteurellaceae bacterium Macca]MCK3657125.1 hypothetical protein [Pasteurellaceae bacterium Macca]
MTKQNNLILTFEQIGRDIKALNQAQTQSGRALGVVKSELQKAIFKAKQELKVEILGVDVDAALDTLREIGDKLKEGSSVPEAITQKLSDITNKLNEQEEKLNDLAKTDYLGTYNQAKGE